MTSGAATIHLLRDYLRRWWWAFFAVGILWLLAPFSKENRAIYNAFILFGSFLQITEHSFHSGRAVHGFPVSQNTRARVLWLKGVLPVPILFFLVQLPTRAGLVLSGGEQVDFLFAHLKTTIIAIGWLSIMYPLARMCTFGPVNNLRQWLTGIPGWLAWYLAFKLGILILMLSDDQFQGFFLAVPWYAIPIASVIALLSFLRAARWDRSSHSKRFKKFNSTSSAKLTTIQWKRGLSTSPHALIFLFSFTATLILFSTAYLGLLLCRHFELERFLTEEVNRNWTVALLFSVEILIGMLALPHLLTLRSLRALPLSSRGLCVYLLSLPALGIAGEVAAWAVAVFAFSVSTDISLFLLWSIPLCGAVLLLHIMLAVKFPWPLFVIAPLAIVASLDYQNHHENSFVYEAFNHPGFAPLLNVLLLVTVPVLLYRVITRSSGLYQSNASLLGPNT
jgi:hypothetical protein